ncbi:MAG: hypothetical protein M1817_001923 [Caeruleum heppii]|nr:MAG: hypothetical protein M1817_001923 [Caeruleum heppii]
MQNPIPATPRVISPTPTPSEAGDDSNTNGENYFAPVTRSAAKQRSSNKSPPILENGAEEAETSDSSLEQRARTRSRSPILAARRRRLSGTATKKRTKENGKATAGTGSKLNDSEPAGSNGKVENGHLSPFSASSSYWRDFSRSPSPLGLIPIHRHWRSVVHRHEIPRKVLHVSIGFVTIHLYRSGVQPTAITPYLLAALVPIATVDYLRHRFPSLNRLYIRGLGALMRESEVEGWNGVIWYLLGAYIALRFFPKDVGTMSVLLLSWCDTAASTLGRAYGPFTPRLRRGKSLAGSVAAFAVGMTTAVVFWGWIAAGDTPPVGEEQNAFLFQGRLMWPTFVRRALGWKDVGSGVLGGGLSLGLVGVWTGLVGALSEVVDLFGWDDNLTIPVLSGLGMWGFLKVFT